nr:MAG TPA: hypothetical protein [Caudoviricetes sp.]
MGNYGDLHFRGGDYSAVPSTNQRIIACTETSLN